MHRVYDESVKLVEALGLDEKGVGLFATELRVGTRDEFGKDRYEGRAVFPTAIDCDVVCGSVRGENGTLLQPLLIVVNAELFERLMTPDEVLERLDEEALAGTEDEGILAVG